MVFEILCHALHLFSESLLTKYLLYAGVIMGKGTKLLPSRVYISQWGKGTAEISKHWSSEVVIKAVKDAVVDPGGSRWGLLEAGGREVSREDV